MLYWCVSNPPYYDFVYINKRTYMSKIFIKVVTVYIIEPYEFMNNYMNTYVQALR